MSGITALPGVGGGSGAKALTGVIGGQARIGVLRGRLRQQQDGRQMHDAAQQQASQQPEQPADHGQDLVVIEGIGASRPRRVATPTGVS